MSDLNAAPRNELTAASTVFGFLGVSCTTAFGVRIAYRECLTWVASCPSASAGASTKIAVSRRSRARPLTTRIRRFSPRSVCGLMPKAVGSAMRQRPVATRLADHVPMSTQRRAVASLLVEKVVASSSMPSKSGRFSCAADGVKRWRGMSRSAANRSACFSSWLAAPGLPMSLERQIEERPRWWTQWPSSWPIEKRRRRGSARLHQQFGVGGEVAVATAERDFGASRLA